MAQRTTPDQANAEKLRGRRIAVTAERRAHQQVRHLEARGAEVVLAPVLATVDLADQNTLLDATRLLISDGTDLLVVQTGQGLRWWLDVANRAGLGDELLEALVPARILCRGSKATSAVRQAGLTASWQAPNESVEDLLNHLQELELDDLTVSVQLDGNDDSRLLDAARVGGATALPLPIYRYELPQDLRPANELITGVLVGSINAVTFTASPAIRHLRQIAELEGKLDQLDQAFSGACVAAVVGPVCAETAASVGWTNVVEPKVSRLMPMLDALVTALS